MVISPKNITNCPKSQTLATMADRHLVEADDDPLRASPPEGGFDARGEGEEKEKGRREGGLVYVCFCELFF